MATIETPKPPLFTIVSGFLLFGAYLFYRWLLPKPISGIPYNTKATQSIFGDIPDMLEHFKHSKCLTDWMEQQVSSGLTFNRPLAANLEKTLVHNSPITQIFFKLFQRPVVVVNDFKEAQDILLRRSKEFDKPDLIGDLLFGFAAEHHTLMKSSEERFKLQRKWLQDIMSPSFLNGVAGPHLHKTFMELISLWQEKMRLSGLERRPFSVKTDITYSALEAIWAALFGTGETATITTRQYDLLSSLKPGTIKAHSDGSLEIPEAKRAPTFDAILRLTDLFEFIGKSPFPRIQGSKSHFYLTGSHLQRAHFFSQDISNTVIIAW